MAKGKERVDVLMVSQGLAVSREKAKAAIMSGKVFANGQRIEKAGAELPLDAVLELKGEVMPYVSRGGLKLAKAVGVFQLAFQDAIVADIGASTGGFTDCVLQNGARKVYAIDVGYGQLDWKLRTDSRVVVMERTNARYLHAESLADQVDWVVSDVAFISVVKIFPAIKAILAPGGQAVILIKPQFEAGREHVGKKGVVKDKQVHLSVLQEVLGAAERQGFRVRGLDYSPIRGPEGNVEYLAWLGFESADGLDWQSLLANLVEKAQKGAE